MNPEFWADKRVFVTGHTGFKGTWLTLWLETLGARTAGFSLSPPTTPNLFDVANAAQGVASTEGDILDMERLDRSMREHEPEVIFHMAAQALVRPSYANPVSTFATNVMGTVNVLEAARRVPSMRAIVVVTSDKCYDNREWLWGYRETEPLGGRDPYSASKACAEMVTASYRDSFFSGESAGPGVASARAGNVIGGGDWAADRLVPDILLSLVRGESPLIRNPLAIRPWQHVLAPLHGYLLLAERLWENKVDAAAAWNFGPDMDDACAVGWLADELCHRWGAKAAWKQDEGAHPHEAHHLRLDSSKARIQLGWQPKLNLAEALDWVVDWQRGYEAGQDVRALTLAQIRQYQERVTA